jgi:hypothetical protein
MSCLVGDDDVSFDFHALVQAGKSEKKNGASRTPSTSTSTSTEVSTNEVPTTTINDMVQHASSVSKHRSSVDGKIAGKPSSLSSSRSSKSSTSINRSKLRAQSEFVIHYQRSKEIEQEIANLSSQRSHRVTNFN